MYAEENTEVTEENTIPSGNNGSEGVDLNQYCTSISDEGACTYGHRLHGRTSIGFCQPKFGM